LRAAQFLVCFFCASPEDERVATFQPNDLLSFACFFNQQRVNFHLRSAFTRVFADINNFCVIPCPAEGVRICQVIINDNVRVFDALLCAQCHETEIAWSCSN
jgi:hypothetical protein